MAAAAIALYPLDMPPNDPTLDSMLRQFLREQQEASRKGFTPEAIKGAVDGLANTMVAHEARDEERHNEVLARVKGVEARVDALEVHKKNADDSGQAMREELKSFNTELEAADQTITAVKNIAETRITALQATLEGEIKTRKDAEAAKDAAELAQYRAEKKEKQTTANSIKGKIFVGVVVAIILAAGEQIYHLIRMAH